MSRPYLILCIGVSGCGKSTLGARLAKQLQVPFWEGDDFHSDENKAHMAAGKPLTDAMRDPWIESMCHHIQKSEQNGVLVFSGLRRAHRARFRELGYNTLFILLEGDKATIANHMSTRKGHFMPTTLLDSQFDALELPLNEPDIHSVSVQQPISQVFEKARALATRFIANAH